MLTTEQAEARRNDRFGRHHVLTEVTRYDDGWGWAVSSGANGFGFPASYGFVPKIGDIVALYTYQGSLIRGMDLNGIPVYYKTDEDLEQERQELIEENKRQRDETFKKERAELDAAFESLPEVFQKRIEWFRSHNPRFRQDFESYELICCIDAVKIAEWAKKRQRPIQAVESFHKKSNGQQKKLIPDLAYEDHSGNTFGFAVRLAYHFVKDPVMVYLEHGAMTPLVGCKEYGCEHPRDDYEGV